MWQLRRTAVIVITFFLIGANTAEAASTLYSELQWRGAKAFACNVLNTGTQNMTVAIDIIDSDGTTLLTTPPNTLAPTEGDTLILPGTAGGALLYCKITLVTGNKAKLRASFCVLDEGGACQASGSAR
jgi:hypothetical protein